MLHSQESYLVVLKQFMQSKNFALEDIKKIVIIGCYYLNNHTKPILRETLIFIFMNYSRELSFCDREFFLDKFCFVTRIELKEILDDQKYCLLFSINENYRQAIKFCIQRQNIDLFKILIEDLPQTLDFMFAIISLLFFESKELIITEILCIHPDINKVNEIVEIYRDFIINFDKKNFDRIFARADLLLLKDSPKQPGNSPWSVNDFALC